MLARTQKKIIIGLGILLALILLAVLTLLGYVAIFQKQAVSLPAPSGPYRVGRSEYDWVDTSRTDPLSDQANLKRELLVWVWYPANSSPSGPAAPYLPPEWARAQAADQGLGRFFYRNPALVQTHSFENAPVSGAQGAYPVILMQPGMGRAVPDYTAYAENLASHGYVVFGINQTYSSDIVVFPDGRIARSTEKGGIPDNADPATLDQDVNRIQKVWVADARFVMDKAQSMAGDPSNPFYKRLDLDRIGLFGHSLGGATAVQVCELDPRCKAAADLDGTLFSDAAQGVVHQPVLFTTEPGCADNCATMRQMVAKTGSAAYYLTVSGTQHFNFSDLPLLLWPPARALFTRLGYVGTIAPVRASQIVNAYLAAFFDQSLNGASPDLLQGSSPAYPEVQFSKR